mmetsp:Transcript_10139/g.11564  ORF Transcript_10139/g.11564 Transcript_10139/m.11564 type:complete len:362 (+) Transcript_10139:252-1337(+)
MQRPITLGALAQVVGLLLEFLDPIKEWIQFLERQTGFHLQGLLQHETITPVQLVTIERVAERNGNVLVKPKAILQEAHGVHQAHACHAESHLLRRIQSHGSVLPALRADGTLVLQLVQGKHHAVSIIGGDVQDSQDVHEAGLGPKACVPDSGLVGPIDRARAQKALHFRVERAVNNFLAPLQIPLSLEVNGDLVKVEFHLKASPHARMVHIELGRVHVNDRAFWAAEHAIPLQSPGTQALIVVPFGTVSGVRQRASRAIPPHVFSTQRRHAIRTVPHLRCGTNRKAVWPLPLRAIGAFAGWYANTVRAIPPQVIWAVLNIHFHAVCTVPEVGCVAILDTHGAIPPLVFRAIMGFRHVGWGA